MKNNTKQYRTKANKHNKAKQKYRHKKDNKYTPK